MAGNNQPILFDNHGPDTRYTGPVEVAQTITSALGTGGNNTPLAVNKEPFCIAGNIVNRKEKNGGNGCGYQQGISYTLSTLPTNKKSLTRRESEACVPGMKR